MRFLDLFWFFLNGDKSSRQIIEEKQHTKPVQQHKTSEAFDNNTEVDEFENEMFEEFD